MPIFVAFANRARRSPLAEAFSAPVPRFELQNAPPLQSIGLLVRPEM